MGALEIFVLIAGGIIFVLSFILPKSTEEVAKETKKLAEEEIKEMVSREMDSIRSHVEDVVDEAVGYAVEKTERTLERLTNEKIMAVNEYSDTVLQEIHKNHEEAMFLYDMLNNKHTNLKNTVSEVNKTVKEAEETKKEAEAVVSSFQRLKPNTDTVKPAEKKDKKTTRSAEPVVTAPDSLHVDKSQGSEQVLEEARDGMAISFMKDDEGQTRNSNDKILELYKQGKSNVAIAKELGLGVGEVKLVIDLYKNM